MDVYHSLQVKAILQGKSVQWRAVAHQPDVPKRIDKSALAMGTPWHLMISDGIKTAICPGLHGTGDERIRVFAEDLDSDRRRADYVWALPAVPGRLGEEDGGTLDFQSCDRS